MPPPSGRRVAYNRAMRRFVCALVVGSGLGLFACDNAPDVPPVDAGPPPPPPWWQPKPGDAKNWDVQLHAPYDVSAPRAIYMLDVFALVPSTTFLEYGDATP